MKAIAINASPVVDKSNAAAILIPFRGRERSRS